MLLTRSRLVHRRVNRPALRPQMVRAALAVAGAPSNGWHTEGGGK